jgi:hypothetical protein
LLPALSLYLVERDVIDARRAVVSTTAAVGFLDDIRSPDFVPEGVEAEGGFSLSFRL